MKCSSSYNLARCTAILFAVTTVFSCTSWQVRAGCGDYVIVGRPILQDGSNMLGRRLTHAVLPIGSYGQSPTNHDRQPCGGTSCSNRDPVPLPVGSNGMVPVGIPNWALLTSPVSLPEPNLARLMDTPRSLLPERHSSPVEHPPRIL
jgi:hypothetical protein